jgi:hypothetical protein
MPSTKDLKEGKVPAVLNLAILVTIIELDVLDTGLVEVFLSRPLESFCPCLVPEPIADEVGITSIDQDWNLLKDAWYKAVEWLHPIALEKEVSVNIEVTAIIAADFGTELLLDFLLVEIFTNIAKSRIAEVAGVLAFATDVIDVLERKLADYQVGMYM